MNKHILKQLEEVAATTPLVFKWEERPEPFYSNELLLTPYADVMKLDPNPDVIYYILMPCLVAVDHYRQLKDAYKRNGFDGVKEYHRSVIDKTQKDDARYKPVKLSTSVFERK